MSRRPSSEPQALPVPVSESTEDGSTVRLYGTHTEAQAASSALGGVVERKNLWAVITTKED